MTALVPALEVGGSHVLAGLVDAADRTVRAVARAPIDPHGGAEELLDAFAAAAAGIDAPRAALWGVAMPDPFDYDTGVARFRGVGKFDALDGVDVGAGLGTRLPGAGGFRFRNDADAFVIGEYLAGAGRGASRLLGLTLGTGVGSGFLINGALVVDGPGVPPGGNARELRVDGQFVEERFSARAIRAAYSAATGTTLDVAEICAAARDGAGPATVVLDTAADALGRALAPAVAAFRPERVVVGGSIAGSWDLLATPFHRAVLAIGAASVDVVAAALGEQAGLVGAAALVAPELGARSS